MIYLVLYKCNIICSHHQCIFTKWDSHLYWKSVHLKYLGKNNSHEVVSTLCKRNVCLIDLLKAQIQILKIQHKEIHTIYTGRYDVEVTGLLRATNQVVKGKTQTQTKGDKKHPSTLHKSKFQTKLRERLFRVHV